MIHAALRGKLSCIDSEDALTCAVFTRLRYLPPEVLCEWIAGARNHVDQCAKIARRTSEAVVRFWPAVKDTYRRSGSVEPDVIVSLGNEIFIIEAKLWSPKSQTEGFDQLAREWRGVVDHYGEDAKVVGLIYITPHLEPPTDALAESAAALGNEASCLWWLSWASLVPILERQLDTDRVSHLVAADLLAYLNRVRLARFRGWRFLARPQHAVWEYHTPTSPTYWRTTVRNNQSWSYPE